jgi:tetratricopeptide (TPR) repeat protein
LLSFGISAGAQPREILSSAYEDAIRAYASGDREKAVSEVAGWPDARVRDQAGALGTVWREARACRVCPATHVLRRAPATAALMLHTDGAQRRRRDGLPAEPHESAALSIARVLKDDPVHRTFVLRWYEAMAGLALGETRWGEARDWAERGLRDFPDSAPMLLVVGSIEETFGALALLRLPDSVFSTIQRETRANLEALRKAREHLEKAHRSLRSAVAAEPSLAEARLRLGRVAWRRGEAAEAREALLEVLSRDPKPDTAFLAHLFLGRLDEDAGRLAEASRAYETALALDPRSQSARFALSHVRLRLDGPGAARREVETAVGFAGRRAESDPYWLYPWGPAVGAEDRLEALRKEASR